MVFVDGVAKVSCLVPVATAEGSEVRTIESIATPRGPLSPVQEALKQHDAVQCGMCFPGMVVSLTALLEQNPKPTREETQTALVGNICRCTGYERIIDSVMSMTEEAAS
jgi:carbon-monoxide dehydrogenase small subunit